MKSKKAVNEFIKTYNDFAEKSRGLMMECGFDKVEAARFTLALSEAVNRILTVGRSERLSGTTRTVNFC